MVLLKFLKWNNQIDAVEAVKIESSLYPLPSPVILNPVYALMSRTKGVWSLKTAFSVDTHDENMISLNSETKHFNPKTNSSIWSGPTNFYVNADIMLLSTGVLYLQGDACWWISGRPNSRL